MCIQIYAYNFRILHLQMSSAKWHPYWAGVSMPQNDIRYHCEIDINNPMWANISNLPYIIAHQQQAYDTTHSVDKSSTYCPYTKHHWAIPQCFQYPCIFKAIVFTTSTFRNNVHNWYLTASPSTCKVRNSRTAILWTFSTISVIAPWCIVASKVWPIYHYSGLCHEAVVWAICLSILALHVIHVYSI